MKTKKLTAKATTLLAAMGLAAAGSANAFTVYPGLNLLEDDDFESQIVDTNGNNQLDVGDTLEGIVNITKIVGQEPGLGLPFNNVLGSGTQLAAIFRTAVTGRTDLGGGFANYTFGTKTGETSIFKFYALNAETFPASGAGCTTAAGCEALLTTGATAWWEFGFTGDADEEWNSTNTPVNPDIFTGISTGLALGNFKFALGLIAQNAGPNLGLVSLNCGFPPFTYVCAGDGKVHLQASGSVLGTQEILAQNSSFPYTVSSDTDFHINVPEPTSMALLGAGLMGFAGFRQRKTQA